MKHNRILAFLLAGLLSTTTIFAQSKFLGGDISLLPVYEDHGAKYLDHDGQPIGDMMAYLQAMGMNTMRVRLFVDPSQASATAKQEGVCQDLEFVKALGKRIKDAGLKFMLDFHYSDTWADPAKQWTPSAWVSLGDSQLADQIYAYTKDALQQLVAAGATPDFIQTGNEISYGLCWGAVNTSSPKKVYAGQTQNWTRFVNMLKKAGQACREVCPQAKIVIHTERVARPDYMVTYYQTLLNDGVSFDILGLSYYSYYHGNLNALETALNRLETNFPGHEIMLVEVGYFHKWQPATVDYDLSATYPVSEDGQRLFTEALIAKLSTHAAVTGLFWWWPEANEYGLDWDTKRVTNGWYNAGLWDNETGRALSALYSLNRFIGDETSIGNLPNGHAQDRVNVFSLSGRQLRRNVPAEQATRGLKPGVYVVGTRKVVVGQ